VLAAAFLVITAVAMVVNVVAFAVVAASLIISLSVMVRPVVSAVFEGALMVFLHKPYAVADRLMISGVEKDDEQRNSDFENESKALFWVVESVDLFKTSLRHGRTKQLTTMPNSALARRHIRNLTRSGQAEVSIVIPLVVEAPTSKILVRLWYLCAAQRSFA
jgi:small-conductance mechanosensitive channel